MKMKVHVLYRLCCFTGARVFGAMKGAADGGLDIPHRYKIIECSIACLRCT